MEITREVVLVKAEESDQCTVTLSIGATEFDLTPEEAEELGAELIRLGLNAGTHEKEALLDEAEHPWKEQAPC